MRKATKPSHPKWSKPSFASKSKPDLNLDMLPVRKATFASNSNSDWVMWSVRNKPAQAKTEELDMVLRRYDHTA